MKGSIDLTAVPDQAIFDEFERRNKCANIPKQKLIVIGAPASGKGTQSERLAYEMCLCHISTGDLLRRETNTKTEIGKQIKETQKSGDLVSDDIMIGLIKRKLAALECKRGAVFDGFPRSVNQAKSLDKLLGEAEEKIEKVFNLDIDKETILERIEGRRVHQPSGRTYHLKYKPPKVEGKDDITGEPLVRRSDDNEETMNKRLEIYLKETKPVLDFYKAGIVKDFNANKEFNPLWDEIKSYAI